MAGIQNAAITVGSGHHRDGGAPYMDDTVMNYDGTNWSVGTPTPGNVKWSSLAGTQNSVLSAGGYAMPHYNYNQIGDYAQRFDGTSWAQVGSLVTRQLGAGGAGLTGYEMTIFGGLTCTPPSAINVYVNTTQEYYENFTQASFHNVSVTNIIGDGSQFSASLQSQLLASVSQISSSISGSFTSGFALQGGVSASVGLYGATWSEVNPLNQARTGGAAGNKAAAIQSAGRTPGGAPYQSTCTELWDGLNWSVATARSLSLIHI